MEQYKVPPKINRIITASLIFVILGAFTVIFMGGSSRIINYEINKLNKFLGASEQLQLNFEKNLKEYTKTTKATIDYLLSLRPGNEEEYIEFIAAIEDLGEKLTLDLNLKFLTTKEDTTSKDVQSTLRYRIAFYGGLDDLQKFTRELEHMPYFIGVDSIDFIDLPYATDKETRNQGNIGLNIKLFIK